MQRGEKENISGRGIHKLCELLKEIELFLGIVLGSVLKNFSKLVDSYKKHLVLFLQQAVVVFQHHKGVAIC